MRFRYFAGLSLVAALAAPTTSHAQTLGVTTQNGVAFTNGQWSLGYFFNVTNPFTVTQLGIWDDYDNGLTESHQIGIYDPLGNLIASTTIGAGGGVLLDHTRMVDITPFVLAIGNNYQVLATTGSENYSFNGTLTNAAGIQYVESAWCGSTTLVKHCGHATNDNGYFGGNFAGFAGTVGPVPEPASMTLIATGLFGVFGAARRRRNSATAA